MLNRHSMRVLALATKTMHENCGNLIDYISQRGGERRELNLRLIWYKKTSNCGDVEKYEKRFYAVTSSFIIAFRYQQKHPRDK